MKWEYDLDNNNNATIYDHNGEQVTTSENPNSPQLIKENGVPTQPDVKGAIVDYITTQIDSSDYPNDEALMRYIQTTQTILSANKIEEREK